MTPLEALLLPELGAFVLASARVSGVVIVAPLGQTTAPTRVKAAFVLLLAFLAHGLRPNEAPPIEILGQIPWMLVVELMVGVAIGFVVRCSIAAAEMCGEVVSPALGLGVAHVFDPATQSSGSLLANVYRHLAIMLALVMGIHRVVLGGLLSSFRLLPVGLPDRPGDAMSVMIDVSQLVLEAGIRTALPLIAILFMTQLALGFIARAAPQMQIFNVGFAVTTAVGLTVMILVLPDMARSFAADLSYVELRIDAVLQAFGGGL